jgi:hypothetical protein
LSYNITQAGTKINVFQKFRLKGNDEMSQTAIPRFMTIRQTAATGILPENCLRLMEKRGELPCVYSGRRCLINFDRLVEMLNNVGAQEQGEGGTNGD